MGFSKFVSAHTGSLGLTCEWLGPSPALRVGVGTLDEMNAKEATGRPVEQVMGRPRKIWAVLPVGLWPVNCQRGEFAQWARIAGWLAVIVTWLPWFVSCVATISSRRPAMPRPWNSESVTRRVMRLV